MNTLSTNKRIFSTNKEISELKTALHQKMPPRNANFPTLTVTTGSWYL